MHVAPLPAVLALSLAVALAACSADEPAPAETATAETPATDAASRATSGTGTSGPAPAGASEPGAASPPPGAETEAAAVETAEAGADVEESASARWFEDVGKPAPDFTLPDEEGREHTLSALRGHPVVLVWFDSTCPYSESLYRAGSRRGLSERWQEEGVHWFEVSSARPGEDGHGVDLNARWRVKWDIANPMLFDETQAVARAFGVQRAPEAVVIDAEGVVRYHGPLDNAPFGNPIEGNRVVSYVDTALTALAEGRPVEPAELRPWGCRVLPTD